MAVKTFTTGEVLTAADTNTYLNNGGLVWVANGSLSLTTTPSNVTGVFSSTWKNYRLIFNITTRSTTNRIDMKYIAGTTPTSSAYYMAGIGSDYASNTVIYYQRSNNDAQIFGYANSLAATMTLDVMTPNQAVRTYQQGNFVDLGSGYAFAIGGLNNTVTQHTGFQLFTSTGTATVEYQVYGYREA